jgi:hypothetical protein
MSAVAAAEVFRRAFENENGCASTPRSDGRAQGGIAATHDEDIVLRR